MNKQITKIVVGTSDQTEAEYGSASDAAFTLLILVDDEVTSVEGFSTLDTAIREAKGCADCSVEVL